MTAPEAITVEAGTYRLEAALERGRWALYLSGNADLRTVEDLNAFLKRAHAEARRNGSDEVLVDISGLAFMNSACFKCFITWLSELSDLPSAERYTVRFRAAPESYWQRRGIAALRGFAPDVVEI